jgi:hypothetical protein
MELQFQPDPSRKLSTKLYDIYHRCVYSEKLLMMDKGIFPKHVEFNSKINLVDFIIRNCHDARSRESKILLTE